MTRYIDGGRNGCQTKAFLKVEDKEKSLGGFDAGLFMLVFLTGQNKKRIKIQLILGLKNQMIWSPNSI